MSRRLSSLGAKAAGLCQSPRLWLALKAGSTELVHGTLTATVDAAPTTGGMTHSRAARLAAEAGDSLGSAIEMEAFGAAFANPAVATSYAGYNWSNDYSQ